MAAADEMSEMAISCKLDREYDQGLCSGTPPGWNVCFSGCPLLAKKLYCPHHSDQWEAIEKNTRYPQQLKHDLFFGAITEKWLQETPWLWATYR